MSKTTFFELNGNQYKVELVEAKNCILVSNVYERTFVISNGLSHSNQSGMSFNQFVTRDATTTIQWESFLISEAIKRGFISGCTIKTATDMDKMKSGRLELIGLSKLATVGRKQIIIYNNGKWVAEAIPEVKKHFVPDFVTSFVFHGNTTQNVGKQLTRDEMSQVKCEPEKYDTEQTKEIIKDLTIKINKDFHYLPITQDQAKLIREILNDYLK